jgi:hypothetical protein
MYQACKDGDLEEVKRLIKGVDPIEFRKFNLPIRYAAEYGHLHIVKYVRNIYVHPMDHFYDIIEDASKNGHLHIIKYFMNETRGGSPSYYNYAMKKACRKNHFDIVQYFIDVCGCDVNNIGHKNISKYKYFLFSNLANLSANLSIFSNGSLPRYTQMEILERSFPDFSAHEIFSITRAVYL